MKKERIQQFCTILRFATYLFFISCSSTPPPQERTFPVMIGDVVEKDIPLYVEAIGNVYSLQTVEIRPQVGGIILEAYVKQGQYVKKGDPLYKIDPRPYEAALDKAKAALIRDTATLSYDESRVARYSEILKKDFVSKLDFEQYSSAAAADKALVLSDKADILTAQLNLEWSMPTSPIEGKISQYNIDPGNLVIANDTNALTNIRQITPADIRFNINQKDFVEVQKSLKEGLLKFEVLLPQELDKPREGQIYFIDNTLDLNTGTILLKGTVANEDEMFWPGEFIKIRLQLKILPHSLLVPEEAVLVGQKGAFLYVYNPETSTVEYRLVSKGEKVGHLILIKDGIKPGEQVVTKGQLNLRPGSKVYLTSAEHSNEKSNP